MPAYSRWSLGLIVAVLVIAVPIARFRWVYAHGKRLREVTPGVYYRSGEMTAEGFREAVAQYHFRTIVNLQDEFPDPDIATDNMMGSIKESELCRQLGVRYIYIPPDLIPRRLVPAQRPEAIDRFLNLLDDPSVYPVLIHCHAGLHRTGVLTAVYRMEYYGWTARQAIVEMKANGFSEWPCTSANDYITQYILTYKPGIRKKESLVLSP